MRRMPVPLYFDLESALDEAHGETRRCGEDHLLAALERLAAGSLPICKLTIEVGRRWMAATDKGTKVALDAALGILLQVR